MFSNYPRQRRDHGFSFIELLAYMAIAALLILAAIPQFNQYRQKAVVSNEQNDVHNASLAAEAANIGTVAKHSGNGVHLAATHLAASTDAFSAIQAAVAGVKTSDGTTLTTTDEGDGAYVITGTNTKVPDIKVTYASEAVTSGGIALPIGISVVQNGEVVDSGSPSASTPAAPQTAAERCAAIPGANSTKPSTSTMTSESFQAIVGSDYKDATKITLTAPGSAFCSWVANGFQIDGTSGNVPLVDGYTGTNSGQSWGNAGNIDPSGSYYSVSSAGDDLTAMRTVTIYTAYVEDAFARNDSHTDVLQSYVDAMNANGGTTTFCIDETAHGSYTYQVTRGDSTPSSSPSPSSSSSPSPSPSA